MELRIRFRLRVASRAFDARPARRRSTRARRARARSTLARARPRACVRDAVRRAMPPTPSGGGRMTLAGVAPAPRALADTRRATMAKTIVGALAPLVAARARASDGVVIVEETVGRGVEVLAGVDVVKVNYTVALAARARRGSTRQSFSSSASAPERWSKDSTRSWAGTGRRRRCASAAREERWCRRRWRTAIAARGAIRREMRVRFRQGKI